MISLSCVPMLGGVRANFITFAGNKIDVLIYLFLCVSEGYIAWE